jgi:hypothetical protein
MSAQLEEIRAMLVQMLLLTFRPRRRLRHRMARLLRDRAFLEKEFDLRRQLWARGIYGDSSR